MRLSGSRVNAGCAGLCWIGAAGRDLDPSGGACEWGRFPSLCVLPGTSCPGFSHFFVPHPPSSGTHLRHTLCRHGPARPGHPDVKSAALFLIEITGTGPVMTSEGRGRSQWDLGTGSLPRPGWLRPAPPFRGPRALRRCGFEGSQEHRGSGSGSAPASRPCSEGAGGGGRRIPATNPFACARSLERKKPLRSGGAGLDFRQWPQITERSLWVNKALLARTANLICAAAPVPSGS
jgi:hypothetical protein